MFARIAVAVLVGLAFWPAQARAATFAAPLAFAETKVGAESAASVVVVADYSGAQPDELMGTAVVSGAAAGDFAITADTCSGLHVRSSCRITVAFRPTAAGSREAKLSLPGQYATAEAPLSGLAFGSGRVIGVRPATLAFGPLVVGSVSAPAPVTVTNAGDLPLSIVALLLGGQAPQHFSFGTQDCFGTALAPGASCSVGVRFNPLGSGTFGAQMDVACAPNCAQASVALSGYAQEIGVGSPQPTPTPTPGNLNPRVFWTLSLNSASRRPKSVLVSVTSYPRMYVVVEVLDGKRLLGVRRPSVLGAKRVDVPVSSLRRGRVYQVRVTAYYAGGEKKYTKPLRA